MKVALKSRCAELQAKGWRQISWPAVVLRNDVAKASEHGHLGGMFSSNLSSGMTSEKSETSVLVHKLVHAQLGSVVHACS